MNITKEFGEIFSGTQETTEEERDVLLDAMLFMRDDVETGLAQEVITLWAGKITGIIEFLSGTGKINEEQEEQLSMMLNRIESGEAAAE